MKDFANHFCSLGYYGDWRENAFRDSFAFKPSRHNARYNLGVTLFFLPKLGVSNDFGLRFAVRSVHVDTDPYDIYKRMIGFNNLSNEGKMYLHAAFEYLLKIGPRIRELLT